MITIKDNFVFQKPKIQGVYSRNKTNRIQTAMLVIALVISACFLVWAMARGFDKQHDADQRMVICKGD
jgi:hypothetical protein